MDIQQNVGTRLPIYIMYRKYTKKTQKKHKKTRFKRKKNIKKQVVFAACLKIWRKKWIII